MVESLCPGADDEGVERALAQQQDLVCEGAAGPVHRHLTRCNNRSPYTRKLFISTADPHHVDADADPDPTFTMMRIRILLFNLIRIHSLFPRFGPSMPKNGPPRPFHIDANSNPAFHLDADADPELASQNEAYSRDPDADSCGSRCGSGFAIILFISGHYQ
jgi:hypothetical protein